MEFLTAFNADRGIIKERNQDSLCVKVAKTDIGDIAMAVVCDGMGGLDKGELASSTVIKAFYNWFDEELPGLVNEFITPERIRDSWDILIRRQNNKLVEYGMNNDVSMGTTLTAIIIVDDKFILTVNIGDSRIYRIKEHVSLLTLDQTVTQYDLSRGAITEEEAAVDPRSYILLQCVGCDYNLEPVYAFDRVHENCMYMLCSDGFRNRITPYEILSYFNPEINKDEMTMQNNAAELVNIVKSRMEYDNISVVLLRTC